MALCTGHSKRTGKPCGGQAVSGSDKCRMHGLGGGRARVNADRRVQALAAREAVIELGLSAGHGRIDPRDALELELWRTHVLAQMYEALVADLELGDGGLYLRTYHANGELTGRAEAHVLVVLRDGERDRLVRVAAAAAKAGVEERRVELEQQRGELIADLIRAVIEDPELGLSAEKRRAALGMAAQRLRLVAGGAA